MGYQTTRNGVPGYVGDNDVFYPNRGETSGYNDASAEAKSLLALKEAQELEKSLARNQRQLDTRKQGVNFSKALRSLVGQGGSLDPMLAEIDAAQEMNKGQVYNQRRAVDQLRVRQGMDPLYKWKDGLNPAQVSVDPAARNVTQVTPGSRARDAAYIEMAQQHDPDYWSREENAAINAATLANEDRTDGTLRVTSDMEGYEDRADIQAWLAANPELKDRFLADRARKAEAGLLQPNPNVNPDTAALAEDAGRTVEDMTKILSPEGLETVFSPQPPLRDEPLWPGPGDPQPPSNQQLAETFILDKMGPLAGGLGRVDQTLEGLAGQLGGYWGQEKAKNMPFGETPVLGDLMQDYGRTKGTEAGKDEYNKKKQQLRQLLMDRIPVSLVNFQR